MPLNNFNVGHDVTVVVLNPVGNTILTFGNITDFESKQETKQIESSPLSSIPLFAEIPHGWSGTFTIDRTSSSTDDFFSQLEGLYWNGQYNLLTGTITEYIAEVSGTVSQYTYSGVVFKFSHVGTKKSQDKITMKVDFRCSLRTKIV